MAGTSPLSVVSLLNALSDAVGEPVAFDEHGECDLEFDGWIDVVVAKTREPHIVSLRSAVTLPSQPLDAGLLATALGLNYTWLPPGHSLALDEATQQLHLVFMVDVTDATVARFLETVAGFLELVPRLRDRFAGEGGFQDDTGPYLVAGTGMLA